MVETSKQIGLMMTFFVVALVGISLMIPVADQVAGTSAINSIANETLTGANSTTKQLANVDISGTLTIINSSGSILSAGNFSLVSLTGVITWTFSEASMNLVDYNVSYSFFPDAFVKDATSRTLIAIIPLFYALAVLLALIALFMIMSNNSFRDLF